MPQARGRDVSVVSQTAEIMDHKAAQDQFKAHLRDRPDLKKLQKEAERRGYKAQDRPEETFGIRLKAKASAGVRPIRGATGAAVREVQFELAGQSVSKRGSEGAVVVCTIRAGDQEETYDMLLEAPGGNFQQAREYTVEKGRVVEAHSWWSAWVGCLHRDCASVCLNALSSCKGTWAAYFWCVVARCGGCVLKCAGCATCDCRWWCRWAVGCCSQ